MRKKYFAVIGYVVILWAAAWLIFGESGVIDTNLKQKEILRLKSEIQRATLDIEEMGQRYSRLKLLAVPDQNFLASVDRKIGNIVVYKFSEYNRQLSLSEKEQRTVLMRALFMGGAFILIGLISITALTLTLKPYGRE